jgi:hypothetical protein
MRSEPQARKVRPIRRHKQSSEKKKWRYACRLFGMNSLTEGAMWQIDPFLGKGHETNNQTTTIAMQQLHKYTTVLELLLGSGL